MAGFPFLFILLPLISHVAFLEAKVTAEGTSGGLTPAIVSSNIVPAIPGRPIKIACLSDSQSPLQNCRWERYPRPNGQRYVVTLTQSANSSIGSSWEDNLNCSCTYNYTGIGLDKGDCSISINNVNEFHFSQWECLLLGTDGHTWVGQLNISDFSNYSKPTLYYSNITNGIVFNATFPASTDLTCCADPNKLNISITLKLQLEAENGTTVEIPAHEDTGAVAVGKALGCIKSTYTFKPEDNEKRLVCIASMSIQSNEYSTTNSLPIKISFGPEFLTPNHFTQNVTDHNSILIEVKFIANPQPDVVKWQLKEDPATGGSFDIRDDHPKYKTSLQHIQGDSYISTLEILNLQPEEDYRRKFQLLLTNPYGTQNVLVQLVNPDPPADASDIYWIIILTGVGTMIVLILLAALIFFAIKRRSTSGDYTPAPLAEFSAERENASLTLKST